MYVYPKLYVVRSLSAPNSQWDKIYGPFTTPQEADDWATKFNFIVPWHIEQIRMPGIEVSEDYNEDFIVTSYKLKYTKN